MIDLILDIFLLDSRRLMLRIFRAIMSLAIPALLAIGSVIWLSVALYIYLSVWTSPLTAALILAGLSVSLCLIGVLLLRVRHRPQPTEDFADALIAALASRAADPDTGRHGDLAALAILIARQLDRGASRKA